MISEIFIYAVGFALGTIIVESLRFLTKDYEIVNNEFHRSLLPQIRKKW